ncbi:MAG: hypothetical protein IJ677_03610 [Alphaproteobacteria bacterium]|nr:hypothetical protein [Alphaproteobacteria bacterium]
MKLQIYTPLGTALNCEIKKISMETLNGYRTLLPRHIDFTAAMNANILSYVTKDNQEKFVACHRGIVVKKKDMVTVTVQKAVLGDTLDDLENIISLEFKQDEENRKELNAAMARLEAGLIRGFINLKQGGNNA